RGVTGPSGGHRRPHVPRARGGVPDLVEGKVVRWTVSAADHVNAPANRRRGEVVAAISERWQVFPAIRLRIVDGGVVNRYVGRVGSGGALPLTAERIDLPIYDGYGSSAPGSGERRPWLPGVGGR